MSIIPFLAAGIRDDRLTSGQNFGTRKRRTGEASGSLLSVRERPVGRMSGARGRVKVVEISRRRALARHMPR